MSEIRVNKITNRSGLGTVTVGDAGAVFSGEKTGLGTDNPRYTVEVGAVGAGGTQLWVNGDARVTGIMSIGQGTITLDPDSNMIKLGALTMHRDSGTGDAILMNTGGTYNPFRASKFLIDATEVIDNNRNFTGVNGTFSGNVSVGGTLTYEDVTNIDSVGVVTAQSGIHVTGGLVAIGTNDPNTELEIQSATDPKIRLQSQESGNKRLDLWIDGGEAIGYIAADQSASQLAFKTAGSERVRITSAGNFGIGTDNPLTELHVENSGSNFITITSSNNNNAGLLFGDPDDRDRGQLLYNITDDEFRFITNTSQKAVITSGGALNIGKGDESGAVENLVELYVGGNDTSHATIRGKYNRTNEYNRSEVRFGVENNAAGKGFLAFATGTNSATERLRIFSDGIVRLKSDGSAANKARFQINEKWNNNATDFGIDFKRTYDTGGDDQDAGYIHVKRDGGASNAGMVFAVGNRNDVSERLRITSGGQVNIGGDYTQTTYQAQVTGDLLLQKNTGAYQHPQMELYNYNTGGYGGAIKFTGNHSGTKYTQATIRTYGGSNTSDGSLAFFTGDGTEKVRIDSAGRIGVNVAPSDFGSGAQVIEVHSSGSVNSFLALTNSTTGSGGAAHGFNVIMSDNEARLFNRENGDMTFWTNSTERLRIDNAGIADFRNPTGTLYVSSTTGNDGGRIVFRENTLAAWSIDSTRANAAFSIKDEYNSSTERLRIDISGRVNVPAGDFRVLDGNSGLLFQEYNNGASLWLDGANGDFSGGDYFGIHANNSSQLTMGYAGIESWKMDSGGRVITPSQPMFSANKYASDGNIIGTNYTAFVWTNLTLNVGSSFNNSTGLFTAPVAGNYFVSFNFNLRAQNNAWTGAAILKNTSVTALSWFPPHATDTNYVYAPLTMNYIIPCAANDTIAFCYQNQYSAPNTGSYGNFASIFLVG